MILRDQVLGRPKHVFVRRAAATNVGHPAASLASPFPEDVDASARDDCCGEAAPERQSGHGRSASSGAAEM